MNKNDFSFNGILASEYGISTTIAMPRMAERDAEEIKIPGRMDPITKTSENRNSIEIAMNLVVSDLSNINAIYGWLSGSGRLIVGHDETKYYNASCRSAIVPETVTMRTGQLPISFICSPVRYSVSNDPLTFSASPADFHTVGTIYSEPIIKIYGSGDITICVNGNYFTIEGVDEYCVIDVPRRVLHKDGVSILSQSIGALTKLLLVPDALAHNHITWTPTCTSVEIVKNERWL